MGIMSSFERKKMPNGENNPKYVDLCDEDQPIAGQKFACLSFVSPEKILKQREQFIFEQFVKEWDFNKSITKLKEYSVEDDFKTFMDQNEENLNEKFQKENNFQTSVRGLKVRGVFGTQEEAELKCKKLREVDPNHDIYVGPVGIWIPWDPDAYKTGRIEFMEDELNQLHNEKIKNEL